MGKLDGRHQFETPWREKKYSFSWTKKKGNEEIRLRLLKEFDSTDMPRDVIEFLDMRISDSIITVDFYGRQIDTIFSAGLNLLKVDGYDCPTMTAFLLHRLKDLL